MHPEQLPIVATLIATVARFLWGRWRHDMVAVAALPACVLAGLALLMQCGRCEGGIGSPSSQGATAGTPMPAT